MKLFEFAVGVAALAGAAWLAFLIWLGITYLPKLLTIPDKAAS